MRILLFAGLGAILVLVYLYLTTKGKLSTMTERLHEKDNRIYSLDRQVAELQRELKKMRSGQ